MGSSESIVSLVKEEGIREKESSNEAPRMDSVKIKGNHNFILFSIGVSRPYEGKVASQFRIIEPTTGIIVYKEEFEITQNYLEKSFMKTLEKPVKL